MTAEVEEPIGPALRLALMSVYEDHARTFGDSVLTPQRYAVLRSARERPGCSQSDVAARIGIARSGVMVIVNALEQARLIRRTPHASDKRSHGLVVTPRGQAAMRVFRRQILAHDGDLMRGVGAADRAVFHTVLRQIVDNARRSGEPAQEP